MLIATALALATPAVAQPAPDFQAEVRPILQKCLPCHGPDEHRRMADLRLDSREAATGQDGGRAGLVPGDSDASRILARVTSETSPMPPNGDRLSAAEVETLRLWIDAGAEYQRHWAFVRPASPRVPEVAGQAWARNPIDHFVLAKLEAAGLAPSGEADRYTLARRLSLDLTGLPPEPEAVEEFASDRSADAYERFVAALLHSSAYGERWASVWLDLARYADSMGYEKDTLRTIWPYRDWVVRAFNENMPFDEFTVQQLAGDLLPEPTDEQRIATGFHRNTMTNTEGGTDDEEFRDAAVKDRTATTGQVWMGLTVGCAQCHSHKYDPISHKEYYSLYAFFNQTADADKDDDSPRLALSEQVSTPVLRGLPAAERRETFVHRSGNFRNLGERVTAGVPAAFHPLPPGAPANRLGLARWIVSGKNPLTARVAVNRLWASLFGRGIVTTEEDFGTQGEPPTHPQLLDWLATEFVRKGWDVKAILALMVTSATYRQASDGTPERLAADPDNALFSRGPRFRLSAEMLRDQALAASGLLAARLGGPPVMPWQPEGIWKVVYSSKQWETSPGQDRYRRALYTLWRRTSPYPSMTTFDAPSGETCTIRRIRTNTPLQALVTLNDPTLMEAAQHLARRSADSGVSSAAGRVDHMFRRVLARPASGRERQRLLELRDAAAEELRRNSGNALKLANYDLVLYAGERRAALVGDARADPPTWRYTTDQPSERWAAPGFDDSPWRTGPSAFGFTAKDKAESKDPHAARIGTRWDTESLWARLEFDLAEVEVEGLRFEARHSGAFHAYINGVFAGEDLDGSGSYAPYGLTPEARRALRPGRNVLAVRAVHTGLSGAPRHVDVGLTMLRRPELPGGPSTPEEAAWVAVANVVLNLDEALA
ncbi:MAG: PSD1 and planctomycete cytochrome C domain-containing protein, partial [Bryobacterales bacterium]|nr:PSD1 and planctomycete cytochrome C domain-containing protein [Bryobacterales bacterium]